MNSNVGITDTASSRRHRPPMMLTDTLAAQVLARYSTKPHPSFFVAICGWADTGKSTLAGGLCASLARLGLGADWLSTDAFLRNRSERNALGLTGYNDLSIDARAMQDAVAGILSRRDFTYVPYDNRTGLRAETPRTLSVQPVVVIEGIHAFHPAIASALDLRVFIDSDEDTLRTMRVRANIAKRGMSVADAHARIDGELDDYRAFTLPLKAQADITVRVNMNFQYTVHPTHPGDAELKC